MQNFQQYRMNRFDLLISFAVKLGRYNTKITICPITGILSVNGDMVEHSEESEKFINDAAAFMFKVPGHPIPGQVYFAGVETPYAAVDVGKTYPSLYNTRETQQGLIMVDDTTADQGAYKPSEIIPFYGIIKHNTYVIEFNKATYTLVLNKLPKVAATTNSTEGAHLYVNAKNESKYAIIGNKKFIFHGEGNYYMLNNEYYEMRANGRFEINLFVEVDEVANIFKKPIGVNIGELLYDAYEHKITIKIGEDFERLYCYDEKVTDAYFNANVEDFPISLLIDNKIYKCCLIINDGHYEFVDRNCKRIDVKLCWNASIIKSPPVPMETIFKFEKAKKQTDEYIKSRDNVRRKTADPENEPILEDEYKSYALTQIMPENVAETEPNPSYETAAIYYDNIYINNILPTYEQMTA